MLKINKKSKRISSPNPSPNKKMRVDVGSIIRDAINFYADLQFEIDLHCEKKLIFAEIDESPKLVKQINTWRTRLIEQLTREEKECIESIRDGKKFFQTFRRRRKWIEIEFHHILNFEKLYGARNKKRLSISIASVSNETEKNDYDFFNNLAVHVVCGPMFKYLNALKLSQVKISEIETFCALKNIKTLEFDALKFCISKAEIEKKADILNNSAPWKCQDLKIFDTEYPIKKKKPTYPTNRFFKCLYVCMKNLKKITNLDILMCLEIKFFPNIEYVHVYTNNCVNQLDSNTKIKFKFEFAHVLLNDTDNFAERFSTRYYGRSFMRYNSVNFFEHVPDVRCFFFDYEHKPYNINRNENIQIRAKVNILVFSRERISDACSLLKKLTLHSTESLKVIIFDTFNFGEFYEKNEIDDDVEIFMNCVAKFPNIEAIRFITELEIYETTYNCDRRLAEKFYLSKLNQDFENRFKKFNKFNKKISIEIHRKWIKENIGTLDHDFYFKRTTMYK